VNSLEEFIEIAIVSTMCAALCSLFFLKKCVIPPDTNIFLLREQISYEELTSVDLKSESID
jgi:hypothetical protein